MATPGVKAEGRTDNEDSLDDFEAERYRTVCGKLMFVALERVDVQYSAKECSCGMSKLRMETLLASSVW